MGVDADAAQLSGEPAWVVLVKEQFEPGAGNGNGLTPLPRREGLVLGDAAMSSSKHLRI